MDTEIEVRKMECKEIRVDVRTASIKESTEWQRQTKILFQINHTMPFTDEYNHLLKELFGNNLGDGSMISPPLNGACVGSVKIGRNVLINSNLLAMARGGITIEDNAMIAANVQLISNNHDPYDLCTLTCKSVLNKRICLGRSWSYDTSGSMCRKTRNCGSWICSDKGCTGLCSSSWKSGKSNKNA